MKQFLYNIIAVIVSISLLFITSMALDVTWIKAQPVRQIIIYLIMLLEVYLTLNYLILLNKTSKNQA